MPFLRGDRALDIGRHARFDFTSPPPEVNRKRHCHDWQNGAKLVDDLSPILCRGVKIACS